MKTHFIVPDNARTVGVTVVENYPDPGETKSQLNRAAAPRGQLPVGRFL
jgi:hypothetical protein